ncbi:DUF742 domain-containing protein [Nocardia aurantiaca]|uniref:DUF742 domain-containing protein n=1 Tax=Nocardia aurantiaca TaxID=2675850 RepID=A0A6I3L8K5_9NOCA|nr:DUF742 domain-containing protein [Nocardia aurantiaca]MTE17094.1 DUF742 domain-containing protein [Nocardia aurantiaca]
MSDSHQLPEARMIALRRPGERFSAMSENSSQSTGSADNEEQVVRPFMVTSGRTTPVVDGLRIEALVRATPAAMSAPLRFELERVVRLCQRPQSIAEIGAALRVPIGVARVLVSDLVSAGHVSVGRTEELSTTALERIRDLVRNL